MSLLSIITINRNNVLGLKKTMQSVLSQTMTDFEYIVVDGASTDGGIDVIQRFAEQFGERMKWISELDKGIYDAMNKGIGMAGGEYVEFLNSGDLLASEDVVERMCNALQKNSFPSILYGNMLKDLPNGKILRDKGFGGQEMSFLGFYIGALNHSPTYISRYLFNKYGLYDESLKIVSDWKWFLKAIVFGGEKPVYTDIDVTLFDMNGISETNKALDKQERRVVLEELITPAILSDYNQWSFSIMQMKRLKRHPWAFRLVWFLERGLLKMERIQRKYVRKIQCR